MLIPSEYYTIIAGQYRIDDDDEEEQKRSVKTIILHPYFDGEVSFDYDIAVVEVNEPFEFNEFVQPIAPWEESETPDLPAFISGWGVTDGGDLSNILKKLNVTIIDKQVCKDAFQKFTDNMLCAKGRTDGLHCIDDRDSGSPMYIVKDNTKYQVGIVSFAYQCSRGLPAAYTEVGKMIDFVREHAPSFYV